MPMERIYDGKGLDPELLALIEPFCISNHAVSRAAVHAGDRVLVMGCGTIGLLAAVSAKLHGGEVYVCDISADKLAYAKSMGIENGFVNSSHEGIYGGSGEGHERRFSLMSALRPPVCRKPL